MTLSTTNAFPGEELAKSIESGLKQLPGLAAMTVHVCHGAADIRIFIKGAGLPDKRRCVAQVSRTLRELKLVTNFPVHLHGQVTGSLLPHWRQTILNARASQQTKPEVPSLPFTESKLIAELSSKASELWSQPLAKWSAAGAMAIALAIFSIEALTSPEQTGTDSLASADSSALALKFDGKDDMGVVPQELLPDFVSGEDGFSVSAWIYPTEWNTHGRIVAREDNSLSDRMALIINYQKHSVQLTINNNAAVAEGLQLNQWSHVVGTYDGETLRTYLNGELAATTDYSGGLDLSESDLWIGNNGQHNRPYAGYVREVQIWSRTLSAEDIQQGLEQPSVPSSEGLLAYWPLSESSDSVQIDQVQQLPLTLQAVSGSGGTGPAFETLITQP